MTFENDSSQSEKRLFFVDDVIGVIIGSTDNAAWLLLGIIQSIDWVRSKVRATIDQYKLNQEWKKEFTDKAKYINAVYRSAATSLRGLQSYAKKNPGTSAPYEKQLEFVFGLLLKVEKAGKKVAGSHSQNRGLARMPSESHIDRMLQTVPKGNRDAVRKNFNELRDVVERLSELSSGIKSSASRLATLNGRTNDASRITESYDIAGEIIGDIVMIIKAAQKS